MSSSKAQEEKNLKIIRELMKLPPNRRCFDCGQMGPVYANCTIGTFICTSCSGMHRELSHRCKSVSMSTFTSAEVEKLQTVGNENAAKEWHASWNPSEYPAPDGNDVGYLRKFLFMTYQEKRFTASQGKGADATGAAGSSKTKKTVNTASVSSSNMTPPKTSGRKESKTALPQPEPLSNILGPNIPSLDVGNGNARSSPHATQPPKKEATLIDFLSDGPAPAPTSSSSTTSKDLMGDLMSLSMAPTPVTMAPASSNTGNFNPFPAAAPAAAPAANQANQQQIQQLQTQVNSMQMAIMSATQQMTVIKDQIALGQQHFAELNPQQREQLAALLQRQQAMNTQFAAMQQQYGAAQARLQQMMAAAAPPPALFAPSSGSSAFAPAPATNSSSNLFGGPSAPASYSALPANAGYSSSPNLFAPAASSPSYMAPSSTSSFSSSGSSLPLYTNGSTSASNSNLNLFGSPSAAPAPAANGYGTHAANTSYMSPTSQPNLFGGYSAQPTSPSSNFGNFSSAPSSNVGARTDFHPFD